MSLFHLAIEFEELVVDFIADATVFVHLELIGALCHFAGVFEGDMKTMLHVASEDGASLVCIVANGDDIVPVFVHVFIDLAGLVVADVDAHLAHDQHSLGVDTRFCLDAARINSEVFAIGFEQAMSHLTAASVASTEHKHFDAVLFCVHCGCTHEEGKAY